MNTNEQLIKWFLSGNTGVSSEAIAAQMTGNDTGIKWSEHPGDTGDFERCSRLMECVPEFRSRIREMATRSPQWAALVSSWDELEELLKSDRDACYQRIKAVLASAPDPRVLELGGGMSVRF